MQKENLLLLRPIKRISSENEKNIEGISLVFFRKCLTFYIQKNYRYSGTYFLEAGAYWLHIRGLTDKE